MGGSLDEPKEATSLKVVDQLSAVLTISLSELTFFYFCDSEKIYSHR
jgi:hypothetical protein